MAGGQGARLWPFSRSSMPKQFIKVIEERSLFELALERVKKLGLDNPLIVTGESYVHIVQNQAKNYFDEFSIIAEPFGKNTSAVICLSALCSADYKRILVMTSDHILDDLKFKDNFNEVMLNENLPDVILYGIKPVAPSTSYGYLQISSQKKGLFYEMESFVEKPNQETAKGFLATENYLWNSGIFNLSVNKVIDSFHELMPELLRNCDETLKHSITKNNTIHLDSKCFEKCQNISFDYGILEKKSELVALKLNLDWHDLGTWKSLSEYVNKFGKKDNFISHNSKNNFVKTDQQKVFLNSVNNTSVLVTKDAILVTDTNKSEDLKDLLKQFPDDDQSLLHDHRLVHRPWGTYDSVDNGETHQVKRIKVYPGGQLSLQKHSKRSEHWVVVKGNPVITVNESVKEYKPNDYIYIEVGDVHRLENFTDSDVEIIEVQCGSYLGEDDIERLEDIYGRSSED